MSKIKIEVSGGIRDETLTYEFEGDIVQSTERPYLGRAYTRPVYGRHKTEFSAVTYGDVMVTRTDSAFTRVVRDAETAGADPDVAESIVEAVLDAVGKGTE